MQIQIETENCNQHDSSLIEDSLDSLVRLKIELSFVISRQSKKSSIDTLTSLIHGELSKFEWIITGSVFIDFLWYLNAIERQETDKAGDLDNIAKPIQDALTGPKGIIIDDSQIKGLYIYWNSKNPIKSNNVLVIEIKFLNDRTLSKRGLRFIQYSQAMCLPVNIENWNVLEMIVAKLLIRQRLKCRKFASKFRDLSSDINRKLVYSDYDYHRTRLNNFPGQIMTLADFNNSCLKQGLGIAKILRFFRSNKDNRLKL